MKVSKRGFLSRKTYLFALLPTVVILPLILLRQYTFMTLNLPNGLSTKIYAQQENERTRETVESDFDLASEESFGFFDDIRAKDWYLMKQRAMERKNHSNGTDETEINHTSKDTVPRIWYQDNFEPDFSCLHERRIGGHKKGMGDGPKWICDPHRIAKQKSCLIYSFGSAGRYHFEMGIHQINPFCEIHTFDLKYFESPHYVNFHEFGLRFITSSIDDKKFFTMQDIVKLLGHEGRTIDIFKIDCEGCEWKTFEDWFDAKVDIRQILLEAHYVKKTTIPFFNRLQKEGYVTFHKEANTMGCHGDCIEYGFLKLDPSFSDISIDGIFSENSPESSFKINEDFQLAYRESEGFFNDMRSFDWERLKGRVWNSINHKFDSTEKPEKTITLVPPANWYQLNFEPDFTCQHERRVGGLGDGGKWACDPHRLKKSCVVYILTNTKKFRFEKGIYDKHSTCSIHTFSPSMSISDVAKDLGHEGLAVDILLVDCNGCEWESFHTWFESRISFKQILVKVHGVHKNTLEFFKQFQREGYVTFHKEPDIKFSEGNNTDYSFLKLDQSFFHGKWGLWKTDMMIYEGSMGTEKDEFTKKAGKQQKRAKN